jgi:hypothetical protein
LALGGLTRTSAKSNAGAGAAAVGDWPSAGAQARMQATIQCVLANDGAIFANSSEAIPVAIEITQNHSIACRKNLLDIA